MAKVIDRKDKRVLISNDNIALKLIEDLCIYCGKCTAVCDKDISVHNHYDITKTLNGEPICVNCGQCIKACPTKAIVDNSTWLEAERVIQKGEKVTIAITAPAVRVALGEEFGYEAGTYVQGKMVAALRELGFHKVFDVVFGADMTIMEEANELVERIKHNGVLPQFTSCCPSWVKFVETYYQDYIPNLSTSKSPISMMAPTIKTWYAKKMGIKPEDIYLVTITPCTSKKFEMARGEMTDAMKYNKSEVHYQDCDLVVTTRELAQWIKTCNITFNDLEDSDFDPLLPLGSGGGLIFGNSGGVMESALRTAYHVLTGKDPEGKLLHFEEIRGMDGIKKATVDIEGTVINVGVAHGLNNARKLMAHIKDGNKENFHFIEVMTCPGGCIGGGGQPVNNKKDALAKRQEGIYNMEAGLKLRSAYETPAIKMVYEEFYKHPLSELSEELLHTSYIKRDDLGEDGLKYEYVEVAE